jgi:hypothetical protein
MNLEQYKLVSARRQAYDTLIWQTPSLAIATQSFLLTIALGPYTAQIPRILTAGLSFVTSVAALQLMQKHRQHERLDRASLVNFETTNTDYDVVNDRPSRTSKNILVGLSSYRLWLVVLGLFCATSLASLLIALTMPKVLSGEDRTQVPAPVSAAISRLASNQAAEIGKLRSEVMEHVLRAAANQSQCQPDRLPDKQLPKGITRKVPQ